ncbi:DUF1353 domain-containing protein [Paracoccus laeviglucosivorans]|uniref:DUF1353 domain-containing protein n=1 Tax=Paracoccus laeviglucosivorans TaxID=1197861 RepID=A0A521AZV6_9RHOB|nr:DUF1353 domain-containing protein [Paracoccus laeviglucosivorans]SMO40319.1 Protein of unknown function [Paracoccus laeviglucosivorans]
MFQRRLPLLVSIFTLSAALAGCGNVNYAETKPGEFSGGLFVMWVGEGGASGDGKFVFVPNPNDRLTFTWTDDLGQKRQIQPEMMYTDGGSIPRIGQLFNGFGPWGYAPAYMIHDWLFVAKHCNVDGTPTPAERKVADITFQQSAEILAASIKALVAAGRVRENDLAGGTISGAVAGPIARNLWEKKGVCPAPRIEEPDRLAAEAAIPGSSGAASLRRSGVRPATVVGAFGF